MSANLERLREQFLGSFLIPLLNGREAVVTTPIQREQFDQLVYSSPLDDELEAEVARGLRLHASCLTLCCRLPWPSEDLVAFSCALHNFILATDPRWGGPRNRVSDAIISWARVFLEQVGWGQEVRRSTAIMRHVVLQQGLALARRDIHGVSWLHRYRYLGRPMPRGFWTKPRGVTVETHLTPIRELWKGEGIEEELLSHSPLTSVLALYAENPGGKIVSRSLTAREISVLADPILREAVARDWVVRDVYVLTRLWDLIRQDSDSRQGQAADLETTQTTVLLLLMAEVLRVVILGEQRGFLEIAGYGGSRRRTVVRLQELNEPLPVAAAVLALQGCAPSPSSHSDKVRLASEYLLRALPPKTLDSAQRRLQSLLPRLGPSRKTA